MFNLEIDDVAFFFCSYSLIIPKHLTFYCCSFGSDELKREFLAPAISGDYVTSIAVSEPSAGSDVAGV